MDAFKRANAIDYSSEDLNAKKWVTIRPVTRDRLVKKFHKTARNRLKNELRKEIEG